MKRQPLLRRLSAWLHSTCTALTGILLCSNAPAALAAKANPRAPTTEPVASMTFEELMHHSGQALSAGEWQAAIDDCNAMLRDYGDRPELLRLRERVQLVLLRCHLQLGRWSDAAPLFDAVLQKLPESQAAARAELLFHKAACELRLDQPAAASKSISASLVLLPPTVPLRNEAILLQAACLLANKTPLQAGELLENILPQLGQTATERAIPLGMTAFLQAEQPERAFRLFVDASARFAGIEETTGLQSVLLEVGSDLLEQGRPAEALGCLLRIATPQQLIRSQELRLASLEKEIASTQVRSTSSAALPVALQNRAAQLRTDLQTLGNGHAFAAATRLQTASAYHALGRPLEAALMLEDAVRQLPPAELLEHASLELAKTWLQLERWQRVVSATEHFESAYPASRNLPLMLYLRGCALQRAGLFDAALKTFSRISKTFKGHELCVSASFMEAFTQLLDGHPLEAAGSLTAFVQTHKKHDLAEAATYWLCVAHAQSGKASAARAAASAYLSGYPTGENRPAVLLRRAQAAHALRESAAAIPDLQELLASTPDHACSGEAALLLGDCLLAAHDLPGALAAWGRVPPSQSEAREEALFKSARLLHRQGRANELRELLRAFDSEHAGSKRLAEAAHWLWKACAQGNDPHEANQWILEHVALHGDNPAALGIEPLLTAAALRAQTESDGCAWWMQLQDLAAAAEEAEQYTLYSRLKWTLARQHSGRDPAAATRHLVEAAGLCPAPLTGPAVLADAAEALEQAGSPVDASRLWRELLKWHPRAPQKDRAFLSLARLELGAHQLQRASHWVGRFERGAFGSPLLPRILLLKAMISRTEGSATDALTSLERILREKGAGAAVKCEALFSIGEIHLSAGQPKLAIPYLQRVYVSYSSIQPWAARAYLASADAFAALGELDAARNTYAELLASPLAPNAPERIIASSKLNEMGGKP